MKVGTEKGKKKKRKQSRVDSETVGQTEEPCCKRKWKGDAKELRKKTYED